MIRVAWRGTVTGSWGFGQWQPLSERARLVALIAFENEHGALECWIEERR
jgi:hypothetical protein